MNWTCESCGRYVPIGRECPTCVSSGRFVLGILIFIAISGVVCLCWKR